MKRAYIPLTEAQRATLMPLFKECFKIGGAVMAQVFTDGVHIVVLPEEVALRVSKATGAEYEPKTNNGYKAFSDGINRDRQNGGVA